MILCNDKPYELDEARVKYLREHVAKKDGSFEIRLHESLSYVERVGDAKKNFFNRTTSPPSVEIEAQVTHHTSRGSMVYRYVETRIPVKNGFRNLPSGIEVRESGKTSNNIELLYFLYYLSPMLEGGEAFNSTQKASSGHKPYFKIYDENLEAKREMTVTKVKAKVEYLISNEWDSAKLISVCKKLFIDVSDDATDERLQKEIMGYLNAQTSSDKYSNFLSVVEKREALIDSEAISLYIEQGIFVREQKSWYFVAGGKKEKIFDLLPVQLGTPVRSLYEYCLKFPNTATKATVEYNKLLQGEKAEITTTANADLGDGERFDLSQDQKDDSITDDEAMQIVDDIQKAVDADIVKKMGNVYKYKSNALGKDQEAIYDKLLKKRDWLAAIRKDLLQLAEA